MQRSLQEINGYDYNDNDITLFYCAILIVIALLGATACATWVWYRHPSKQSIDLAHKKISSLIAHKRWEQALALLKPLHAKKAGGPKTQILYAHVLRHIHHASLAQEVVEEALKHTPKHLGLQMERGKALLELGHPQRALDHLGQCLPVFRTEEDYLDFASSLFQTGHVDTAWEQIASLVPESTSGRLHALAGDIHFQRKSYQEALTEYLRAHHCNWTSHYLTTRMAYSMLGSDNIEAAERAFRRILDHDNEDIASTLGLGGCLERSGDYEAALATYQNGKIWDCGNPNILHQAGCCALHTKQFRFAELYLNAAIQRGVQSPKAFAYLGYSLECQGKWSEAEAAYLALTNHHPEHPAGYRGLAWLYGIGRSISLSSAEGLAAAHKAVDLMPDFAAWELLSACEARAGNYGVAHDIQERLSQTPEDAEDRQRRRHAMRTLRKGLPLDETLVYRPLVA